MRRFDTVIFDLDGTLLDTLEDLADSTNYALRENGFPTRSLAEVRQFVGNGVARLIHLALPARVSPELEAKCLETFKGHYRIHMRDKTGPYPGVPALLERLQADGFRMAVASMWAIPRSISRRLTMPISPAYPYPGAFEAGHFSRNRALKASWTRRRSCSGSCFECGGAAGIRAVIDRHGGCRGR